MEVFASLFGLVLIYSWVHFVVISFASGYKYRSGYEKVVTWVAIVSFALYVLGTLSA